MIFFPGVMGLRDLPDVPLDDDGPQIKIHLVVLAASRPEYTFSENTLPTLIHRFISQVRTLPILSPC